MNELTDKRRLITYVGFICTLLLCFIAMHVMSLFTLNYYVGLIIGAVIFGFTLVLAISLNKVRFIHFFVVPVNAVASGIALSSLYVYLEAFPAVWQTACVFAVTVVLFAIYLLLTKLAFIQKHCNLFILVCSLLLITAAALGMGFSDLIAFSLAMMSLIPFISFSITAALRAKDDYHYIKNVAICSFAVLILVIIVVMIVISQGDGLDGFAAGDPATKKKKKEINKNEELK